MNQLFPIFMFLSVGAVALFSFVAIAAWSDSRRKEREAYYKSETLKKIAETQGAGGNAALEFLREQEKIAERRRREGMRLGGMTTGAIGIALMILLRVLAQDPSTGVPAGVYLVGLFPLLIGIVLLVYSYLLASRE